MVRCRDSLRLASSIGSFHQTCHYRLFALSPERATYDSPGQRPGKSVVEKIQRALKGRNKWKTSTLYRPCRAFQIYLGHPGRCPGLTYSAPSGLEYTAGATARYSPA